MRKWIFSRSVLLFLIAAAFLAHADVRTQGCTGFAPPNDLYFPDDANLAAGPRRGISRAQFNEILDRITAEYSSQISRAGGILKIERKWTNGTVNAYAYRDERRHWFLSMFGGMARHPMMTYDGFMSVACHELGHHLGGLPHFTRDWASVEGEADYYAMLKCMRRMFANEDNRAVVEGMRVDPEITRQCEREYRSQQEQQLCQRIAQAGVRMATILASMEKDPAPKVSTPSQKKVKRLYQDHPFAQCRLDTYFQASLCNVDPLIPMSDTDPNYGACAQNADVGYRPLCWYHPPTLWQKVMPFPWPLGASLEGGPITAAGSLAVDVGTSASGGLVDVGTSARHY